MLRTPPFSDTHLRRAWWGVVAMVAIVLGLPALLAHGPPARRPLDEAPLRLMKKEQPACVLVGDSMLESRIDAEVLSRLSGERCFVLAQAGSSTATWYLLMKNFVAALEPPPHTVIILFRDRQLTRPEHRAEGRHRAKLEPYMRPAEPELENIVGRAARQRMPRLERVSLALYPIQRAREVAQDRVQSWALDFVASSREYLSVRVAAKELFGTKRLRVGQEVDEDNEGARASLEADDDAFADAVGESFLPLLIEIARERRIQLIFYRVKRRLLPSGELLEESRSSDEYQHALRAWLEKMGARFFDETREVDVTAEFYGSGDHVAPAMMPRYTELFWRKIEPLVERQAPPVQ